MFESLRDFVCREAGIDAGKRLPLIRYLAPYVFIEGWDLNELRELVRNDIGAEYISANWPDVPVTDPLRCITIRPFIPGGYTTSSYEPVPALVGHLRDVLIGVESSPDLQGFMSRAYIKPGDIGSWMAAAQRWRESQGLAAPLVVPVVAEPEPQVRCRSMWDVVTPYIVETIQAGQFASAKQLFQALEAKAGQGSPFDRGTGLQRDSLFVRETCDTLAPKTLANNWQKLLTKAAKK